MVSDEWLRQNRANIPHALHGQIVDELLERRNPSPDVIGPAAPLPSPVEAIEAHVRQIQILCDHYNYDESQWLAATGDGEVK
jgi:hypothetical protein